MKKKDRVKEKWMKEWENKKRLHVRACESIYHVNKRVIC